MGSRPLGLAIDWCTAAENECPLVLLRVVAPEIAAALLVLLEQLAELEELPLAAGIGSVSLSEASEVEPAVSEPFLGASAKCLYLAGGSWAGSWLHVSQVSEW